MHPTDPVLDGPKLDTSPGREPEFRGGQTPAGIERAARGVIGCSGAQGFPLALEAIAKLDKRADRS